MKSKVVALSSISAGFIAILLTIGAYIEIADIFCVAIASCFVVLPLYFGSYKGSVLTYLVGGVIAFMFSGFNLYSLVFPSYFLFGGLYPIIALYFREKRQKITPLIIVGFIYSVAFFIGIYYYYVFFMKMPINDLPKFISDNILFVVGALGGVFYFVYDRFIVLVKRVVDIYLKRILK